MFPKRLVRKLMFMNAEKAELVHVLIKGIEVMTGCMHKYKHF